MLERLREGSDISGITHADIPAGNSETARLDIRQPLKAAQSSTARFCWPVRLCWVAAFGLLCWRIEPVLWRLQPDGLRRG